MRTRSAWSILAVALCATGAAAQVVPTRPRGVPAPATQPSTIDTTRQKPLVSWEPLDSTALELMKRRGYSAVRYQADEVTFDAIDRTISLLRKGGPRSVVERAPTVLVADTIRFSDLTDSVQARGDTIILRDPPSADLVMHERLAYDLARKEGLAYDVSTAAKTGETWYVEAHRAAFAADTAAGANRFYGRSGTITSCTDSIPHYHFSAKEIKRVTGDIVVARNVWMHIQGVPVLWLPFIFQDDRQGRRSGILTPRFGLTELVRNSPTYRRTVENIGYYFALSDYYDAAFSVDWRSGAKATDFDPGWTRWNSRLNYRWLDRFFSGSIGASYHTLSNGSSNTSISWTHQQDFNQNRHLTASLNFSTSTTVQRQTAVNALGALGVIASQVNFVQNNLGPLSLGIGGSRKQYPGRPQVDNDFPSLNVTSKTIKLAEWAEWTPTAQVSMSSRAHMDGQGDFTYRFITRPDGTLDSAKIDRGSHSSQLTFNTPFKIFDFQITAAFRASDAGNDFSERRTVVDPIDTTKKSVRVFEKTYLSQMDFDFGMNLPQFLQGSYNIVPNITMSNVGPGAYWVRSERTGSRWVSQSKRLSYGLSMSPTLYGLFAGVGPVQRIRHSITTSFGYSYSPATDVPADYLAALGQTKTGFLGSLAQNRVTLSIQQVFEAKMRGRDSANTPQPAAPPPASVPPSPPRDSNPPSGQRPGGTQQATPAPPAAAPPLGDNTRKVKLLSLTFSPLTWDFERARHAKSGFATDRFSINLNSELIPGFDFGADYSLFQGNILSDTAKFSPYLESIRASFQLGEKSAVARLFASLFGGPTAVASGGADSLARSATEAQGSRTGGTQSIAGQSIRGAPVDLPSGRGFEANVSFSLSQQRPPVGGNVVNFDPTAQCLPYKDLNPIQYDICIRNALATPPTTVNAGTGTAGGTFFRVPPQSNVQARTSFNLTPKWSAAWSTNYDFKAGQFGMQQVTLQRDLHDWRAVFGFTQAPNGNFAFTFFVALKAEPDIKFNYDRNSYGSQGTTLPR